MKLHRDLTLKTARGEKWYLNYESCGGRILFRKIPKREVKGGRHFIEVEEGKTRKNKRLHYKRVEGLGIKTSDLIRKKSVFSYFKFIIFSKFFCICISVKYFCANFFPANAIFSPFLLSLYSIILSVKSDKSSFISI